MSHLEYQLEGLVQTNCFLCGEHPRLTSKKITQYLLGTRQNTEFFKLYELRYLLLKTYPLIHNLFNNPRSKLKLKFKDLFMPSPKPQHLEFPDASHKSLKPLK